MSPAADLSRLSLTLAGAGKMGLAMLEGWAERGLAGAAVTIIEPHPSDRLAELCGARGFRLVAEVTPGAPAPQVLVLAVKPQMLDAAASALAPLAGASTLIVSILAGKRVADLAVRLPGAGAIVRAMPNTPAAIGRGVTGAFASAAVTQEQRALADALLGAVGGVEWVDEEALIDAVTAVSGSGPAYVFHLVEALAAAGAEAGLPADLALRLARATVEGAGELLYRNPELSAETLRKNVTSPGGTTAAALEVLMAAQGGLPELMVKTVAAARRRAEELSG